MIFNYSNLTRSPRCCRLFVFNEKYLSWIAGLILCVSSLIVVSCKSKEVARKHDLDPKDELVRVVTSDEDKVEIKLFQQELSEAFDNADRSFLEKRFNIKRLLEMAVKGLDLAGKEKADFGRGMRSAGPSTKRQLVDTFMNSNLRFMKSVNQTRPALLYRMIMNDDSFTYVEFHLEKSRKWEIVDLYFYTNGKPTSHMVREASAQMLPNKGGLDNEMLRALKKSRESEVLTKQGKPRKAWEKWKTISPKAHHSRAVLTYGYMAAFQLCQAEIETNEDVGSELKEVFSLMSKNFPNDPGFAILELAVHHLNGDYDKYRDAINRIRKQVGDDPYLDLQEAIVDLAEEEWDVAIERAERSLREEPETLEAYDVLWAANLGKKDYKRMTELLSSFVELYEVEKSVFIDEPSYQEYFASPEGQAWLKE